MSAPIRYKKKPVVIEAMRWDGSESGAIPIVQWIGGQTSRWDDTPKNLPGPGRGITTIHSRIEVDTLEGTMYATPGDWIVRGVQGEFYPVKPDIFEATYEKETDDGH